MGNKVLNEMVEIYNDPSGRIDPAFGRVRIDENTIASKH